MRLTKREFIAGMATSAAAISLPGMAAAASSLVVPTYGGLWAKFWQDKMARLLEISAPKHGE